eukprot:TRINITY_DN8850_c0_g1_i1.p1 TRINITY_DN8850_c0_g1~~TRINITY_DN8850_c0_g1_i1.p1  ORF type:complete len:415 (-),score=77.61 TRINITY_DN8850_c0_g1_i1:211-1455(-)
MTNRLGSVLGGARRRCALAVLADYAEKPLEKRSVPDLVRMAALSQEDRAVHLHETLKVGLAKCAMRMFEMPFGFCNSPSIKHVASTYVDNFRQVMEFEHDRGTQGLMHQDYTDLTKDIFNQHRGTMLDVAKGVFEFREDLSSTFGTGVDLADLRNEFEPFRDIEHSLDEFFTNRLTLRIMISHVHTLNKNDKKPNKDMVGVVNVNTEPIAILSRAYIAARFMCQRDYKTSPSLLVNDVPYDEYLQQVASTPHNFPYVHTHLFYVFLELLKNAARASIEGALLKNGCSVNDSEHTANDSVPRRKGRDMHWDIEIPPVKVIIPEDKEVWRKEKTIKLADSGIGMSRTVLSKASCYYYSSVKARPTKTSEMGDFDKQAPLAGFGFGLPISRITARYFSGGIDLNSIPGKGTDVYIYL